VKSSLGGNTVSADLPDFHYRNKSTKGKQPPEAFGEIFEELYGQVKGLLSRRPWARAQETSATVRPKDLHH